MPTNNRNHNTFLQIITDKPITPETIRAINAFASASGSRSEVRILATLVEATPAKPRPKKNKPATPA